MSTNRQRTQVFVSYSREDEEVAERLSKHLRSVIDKQRLKLWRDVERIEPGDLWEEEIKGALDQTAVAIALVSADFLDSEFVREVEIPALVAAAHDGASIVPVIVKPSTFQHSRLSPFQSINRPEQPLVEMSDSQREAVYVRLAERVSRLLESKELQALKARAEELNDRQDKLEFVIKSLVGWPELYLLRALNGDEDSAIFDKKYRHQTHLRRLRGLEFIEHTEQSKPVGELHSGEDLRLLFRLTENGRRYLTWVDRP